MTKHKLPKRVLAFFQAAGKKGGDFAAANMSRSERVERARVAGKASVAARRAAKKRR